MKKYKIGDKIGPYQLELIEETKITSYGHRYGLFRCKCGEIFETKIYNVVRGDTQRCKKCRQKARSGKNNNNFKDLIDKKYGKLTVVEYLGSKQVGITKENKILTNSLWRCKCSCGNFIEKTTNELERNNVHSCPKCHVTSIGEEKIKELLEELEIDFICQYSFLDCRDKNVLPFDFYIPEKDILIEYDGLGHYENSIYDSSWRTEKNVELTKMHDKIKNEYCLKNNIKLIRIPYFDYNKLTKEYLAELMAI